MSDDRPLNFEGVIDTNQSFSRPQSTNELHTGRQFSPVENELERNVTEHQLIRKSQIVVDEILQQSDEDVEQTTSSHILKKNVLNLSNEEFDLQQDTSSESSSSSSGTTIQHSLPAVNLILPFFPTFLSEYELRHFHRLPLEPFGKGALSKSGFYVVHSVEKHIHSEGKTPEGLRQASGEGEVSLMSEPESLSGKDGELILCEYSEQYPPLLMQPGMATKIMNYYKGRPSKGSSMACFDFGETAYPDTSPFLGSLHPGQSLQALENNLFRAPAYQHEMPETDFLIIRIKDGLYVRRVNTIFCIGQELPLTQVPTPKSKKAKNFASTFLTLIIYRLFWQSKEKPRRIHMEDIRRAFPLYPETSVRKRLRVFSTFKRRLQASERNFWILNESFRLPNLDEIRLMVTPEMCCAYYSMLAAEQRLKDTGYGEDYLLEPGETEVDKNDLETTEEMQCAPWNTTKAYIAASKGKCRLDLTGIADPTGRGEAFSFVRVPLKIQKPKRRKPATKELEGTDADLRKLPLENVDQPLLKFGVKDQDINTLTRGEMTDAIRALSTEDVRRGNIEIKKRRVRLSEVQERYSEEYQRIFDLQNRILSSREVISTDEEENEADKLEIEEMGRNIEALLAGKNQVEFDYEKNKQAELEKTPKSQRGLDDDNEMNKRRYQVGSAHLKKDADKPGPRKLMIYRTYRDADGTEHETVECVSESKLIDAYVKIRTEKDEKFIRKFAQMDKEYREERRKEKRRLREQIRRMRKKEMKEKMGQPVQRVTKVSRPESPSPLDPLKSSLLNMRCSACGRTGHLRTTEGLIPFTQRRRADPRVEMSVMLEKILNELKVLPEAEYFLLPVNKKNVPDYYDIVKKPMDLKQIRMNLNRNNYVTREEFLKDICQILDNSRLYNGDQSYITKAARDLLEQAARRVAKNEHKIMKLEKAINPLLDDDDQVVLNFILEQIVDSCKAIPESFAFHEPVNCKKVKTYYDEVKNPMDLGTMKAKCRCHMYHSVADFLKDVEQIYMNSESFNGPSSSFTLKASEIVELAKKLLAEKSAQLACLERNIHVAKEKSIVPAEIELVSTDASSAQRNLAERHVKELDEKTSSSGDLESSESLTESDSLLSDKEESGTSVSDSSTVCSSRRSRQSVKGVEQGKMVELGLSSDESSFETSDQSKDSRSMREAGLQSDLALSDSDEEEEAKRAKLMI